MSNIKVILTPGQRAILENARDHSCKYGSCDPCPVKDICHGDNSEEIAGWLLKQAEE